MAGYLEPFERFDAERIVNPLRELRTDPRNRLEQRRWIEGAAQPLELRPTTGLEHLGNGGRDADADARERIEPVTSLHGEQSAQAAVEPVDGVGGLAIGADAERVRSLRLQKLRRLPQPFRNLGVVGVGKRAMIGRSMDAKL